ncbi:MAG: hypothetical protein C0433_04155 [Cyclobacterium sp.]|nr:hypothetical protein [Cyclobacterium sp.]
MKQALILVFWLLSNVLLAQDKLEYGNPISEIKLNNLDLVSLDTRDQIFVSNATGDVYLFNKSGKQLNLFSPTRQARIHQLEASWTVNIFTFSADLQEYRIMDRFLNPIAENSLLLNTITLPKAATLGNNNIIWIWDESDLSLKSLDYLRKIIIQSQPLNLILNSVDLKVTEIREFKNRLFMNVPTTGIFIFDNQGNFIQKADLQFDQRMCFYNEHLFWVDGENLKMYSISTKVVTDLGPTPVKGIESVQIGREIITFVVKNGINVYVLPESLNRLK